MSLATYERQDDEHVVIRRFKSQWAALRAVEILGALEDPGAEPHVDQHNLNLPATNTGD